MDPYLKHLNELVNTVRNLTEELEIAYEIIDNLFEEEDFDLHEEVLLEKKKWIQAAIEKEGSLRKTLKAKPQFTGQITIEVHVKGGEVKDVYVTERAKVNEKT